MRPRLSVMLFSFVLGVSAAHAQQTGGAAQSASPGERDPLQALIKELNEQFDRGERERLIDPWFLRDLRQTLAGYEWPWGRRLLSDDFSGRGPQPDPPWKVTAGEFLMDWRFGLRSVVKQRTEVRQREQTRPSEKEAVGQLFGQILQEALQGKPKEQEREPERPSEPGYAAVIAPVAITNAFALRLEMTSRQVDASSPRFEFGPYQGANASAGYRLAYVAGAKAGAPSLELVKLSPRGTVSTIELYDKPLKLEDGKAHVFEWTRDRRGRMVVKIDGSQVMDVTDRRFPDPFDGFAVVNRGGDYALRSLTIDGTG